MTSHDKGKALFQYLLVIPFSVVVFNVSKDTKRRVDRIGL